MAGKVSIELTYTDASGFKKVLTGQTVLFRNTSLNGGSDQATTEISDGVYESTASIANGVYKVVLNSTEQNKFVINGGIDGQYILDGEIGRIHIADEAIDNDRIADDAIDDRVISGISANLIGKGDVTDTILSYISGVSSDVQDQIDDKIDAVVADSGTILVADGLNGLMKSDFTDGDLSTLYSKLLASYDYHIKYSTSLDGSGDLAITKANIQSLMKFATDGTEEILAGVTVQIYYETDSGTYKTNALSNYAFGSGKEISEKSVPYAGTGIYVLDTIFATGGTPSQKVSVIIGFNKVDATSYLKSS